MAKHYVTEQDYRENWTEAKKSYVELMFGDFVRDFKLAGFTDDREIVVNLYEMIMEALDSLDENPINYVRCAMNKAIRKDLETMAGILDRFGLGKGVFV